MASGSAAVRPRLARCAARSSTNHVGMASRRSPARDLGLTWVEVPPELVTDRNRPGKEVEVAHRQPGALSPAQPANYPEPHHRRVVSPKGTGQPLKIPGTQHGPFDKADVR